jgi:hypothetical protein
MALRPGADRRSYKGSRLETEVAETELLGITWKYGF